MGEIIAAVIVYNEEELLPGCLESLQGQVQRIVVADGAYEHYPHDKCYSTDKTCQIAECYGAEWIDCPRDEAGSRRAWVDEVEKRNAYLVGQEGDWYLRIDADERLIGRIPALMDYQPHALFTHGQNGQPGWILALFQHHGVMRYEGAHVAVWENAEGKARRLLTVPGAIKVDTAVCRMAHLAAMRSAQRQSDDRIWEAWLEPAEHEYRWEHGI